MDNTSKPKYYTSFKLIKTIFYFIFALTLFLTVGFIEEWDLLVSHVFGLMLFSLAFSFLYTYLYFLPYLIANKKAHPQTRAIYILNIFAGWTILAWLIALIWANTVQKENITVEKIVQTSNADELKKYKDLFDQGIITEEEFNAKKKQLLGL